MIFGATDPVNVAERVASHAIEQITDRAGESFDLATMQLSEVTREAIRESGAAVDQTTKKIYHLCVLLIGGFLIKVAIEAQPQMCTTENDAACNAAKFLAVVSTLILLVAGTRFLFQALQTADKYLVNAQKQAPLIAGMGNFGPEALAQAAATLIIAASTGDLRKIVELQRRGVALDGYDSAGKTAMHWAAEKGQRRAIDLLWYYGCNIKAPTRNADHSLPVKLLPVGDEPLLRHVEKLMIAKNRFDLKRANYLFYPLETLVIKGGGPKGIAYVGVQRGFEACPSEYNVLKSLFRVAGTSAGAITSMMIALGYSADEMKIILGDTNLTEFLDHDLIQQLKQAKEVIDTFRNPKRAVEGFWNITLGDIKNATVTAAKWFRFSEEENKIDLLKKELQKISEKGGVCDGDKLLKWIKKLIGDKTGDPECTFGKLREMIEAGKPFKHLHLFATKIPEKTVAQMNSESGEWDHVEIANGIRASASVPFAYKPHKIIVRKATGVRDLERSGYYIDGGLIKNCPIQNFDLGKYCATNPGQSEEEITNWQTLALNLTDPPEQIASVDLPALTDLQAVVKNTFLTIFGAEEILQQNPTHAQRMIHIDNKGIGLISGFFATEQEKQELIGSGYKSVNDFFVRQKAEALQLADSDPRALLDPKIFEVMFGAPVTLGDEERMPLVNPIVIAVQSDEESLQEDENLEEVQDIQLSESEIFQNTYAQSMQAERGRKRSLSLIKK